MEKFQTVNLILKSLLHPDQKYLQIIIDRGFKMIMEKLASKK